MKVYKVYEEWKAYVDLYLRELCGLDSDCLPDYNYRKAFDSKRSPLSTAKSVIFQAKDY